MMDQHSEIFISKNILHIVSKGKMNIDILKKLHQEAIEKAKENNINKYLINHRQVSLDSDINDALSFSFYVHENSGDVLEKIALLIPSDDPYLQRIYSIYKNSMALKGYKLNLFFDEDEAIQWLK